MRLHHRSSAPWFSGGRGEGRRDQLRSRAGRLDQPRRDNIRHRISNPVEQARKAKYELNKRLKVQKGWPADRNIRMRHGVIFPDVKAPPGHLGADKPRNLFCCRDDMSRIADWVTDGSRAVMKTT